MSFKIKKGASPKGTMHTALMWSGNVRTPATYKVHDVTGVDNDKPSEGAIIWLVLAAKTMHPVDNFVLLPLHLFVEAFKPATEADLFWEQTKTVAK